jgi:hypothetical protein
MSDYVGEIQLRDQHSRFVVAPFHVHLATVTLAANTTKGDYVITLEPGHGAVAGNIVILREGIYFYWGTILTVVTNTITLDTPLDYDFTTTAMGTLGDPNLNKDGSGAVVSACVQPPPGVQWDITRLHVAIVDNAAMDSSKFGGIDALTRGCVFGKVNGINTQNIANVKTNADMVFFSISYSYDPKAPAGIYGLFTQYQFGGQGGVGVTIRLDGSQSDLIQLLIQDDLTELTNIRFMAVGHVVED